jgi:hypothetical protein
MTALDARVGDTVLVRGEAIEVIGGVGVRVELFSKTDQYRVWVREDLVAEVLPLGGGCPPEPGDGAWIAGDDSGNGVVFHCDDAHGRPAGGRRFDQRWWDFACQEWVDWPTVLRRGADPGRVLREG